MTLKLLAGVLVLAFAGCGDKAPRSIVLIMIDTLRTDHIECYGFDGETAPCISRLGKEGVLFENAFAASPWTGPSVVSIITGNYPDEVGIRDLRDPLPGSADTLAERLKRAGYSTAAVISNSFIGPAYNHQQGYDSFFCRRHTELPADLVTDKAIEVISRLQKEKPPFFLYVHYTDPHNPYEPPADWLDRFLQGKERLAEEKFPDENYMKELPTLEDFKTIRAYYDAETGFTDHQVGRLLDVLPADTSIALIADHGEEFFEHGGFLHGHTLYQELLHVPFIIKGPGLPRGATVDEPVSHVDITPTLLELAGIDERGGMIGRSLVPLLEDPGSSGSRKPAFLFSVLENNDSAIFACRMGPWKLHLIAKDNVLSLYNLEQDPWETKELSRENPDIVKTMLDAIKAREKRIIPAPLISDPKLEKAREDELRALGYIK